MGSELNVAGNPLLIGDKIAIPTKDGKVQLMSKDGSNAVSMEMNEFKQYLAAHEKEIYAANSVSTDTTSFKGNIENAEPEEEEEKKGMGSGAKLLLVAGVTGIAIWQRKNISKYLKKLVGFFKNKTNVPPAETKSGEDIMNKANQTLQNAKKIEQGVPGKSKVGNTSVHHTTGEPQTNEQIKKNIENIETKDSNTKSRKLVEKHADDVPSAKQQEAHDKEFSYKNPTKKQEKIINKGNKEAEAKTSKNNQIQNKIDDKTIKTLKSVKTTNPISANKGTRIGKLQNGKAYAVEYNEKGQVISIINGESEYVNNPVKIAKFFNKHNIDPNKAFNAIA